MTIEHSTSSPEHVMTPELELEARRRDVAPDGYAELSYPPHTNAPLKPNFSMGRTWVEAAIAVEPDVLFVPREDERTYLRAFGPERVEAPRKTGIFRKIGRFLGGRHDV